MVRHKQSRRELQISDERERETASSHTNIVYGVNAVLEAVRAGKRQIEAIMMYYAEKQPIPYARAFFVQAVACYLWALVTPFVLWMARSFRIERANWRRNLGIHLGVSLALIAVLLTIHFVTYMERMESCL